MLRTTGASSWLLGEIALTDGTWENAGTITASGGILSGPGLLENTGTIVKNGALRGLPKGRYTVKVAVRLSDGRTFTVSRRYRTCAPKSRSDSSHSRSALSASSA